MSTSVPMKTAQASARSDSRVWNRDFLLLWQGKLVSSLGDVSYEIALGFWILIQTGSTGLPS